MPQTDIHVHQDRKGRSQLLDWLMALYPEKEKAFFKGLAMIDLLASKGFELRRPIADTLRDGINELRWKDKRVNYRILYGYHGKNESVLLHGLTKEGKVPANIIEMCIDRLNEVHSDRNRFTATFPFEAFQIGDENEKEDSE